MATELMIRYAYDRAQRINPLGFTAKAQIGGRRHFCS